MNEKRHRFVEFYVLSFSMRLHAEHGIDFDALSNEEKWDCFLKYGDQWLIDLMLKVAAEDEAA